MLVQRMVSQLHGRPIERNHVITEINIALSVVHPCACLWLCSTGPKGSSANSALETLVLQLTWAQNSILCSCYLEIAGQACFDARSDIEWSDEVHLAPNNGVSYLRKAAEIVHQST